MRAHNSFVPLWTTLPLILAVISMVRLLKEIYCPLIFFRILFISFEYFCYVFYLKEFFIKDNQNSLLITYTVDFFLFYYKFFIFQTHFPNSDSLSPWGRRTEEKLLSQVNFIRPLRTSFLMFLFHVLSCLPDPFILVRLIPLKQWFCLTPRGHNEYVWSWYL